MLGLGPTPQDVGTHGTQSKIPTRLQMEMEARRQAEQQVVALSQRMDQLQQQLINVQEMMLAQGGKKCGNHFINGSNS